MKKTQIIADWLFVNTLSKWQIKILLVILGFVIVITAVIFTNMIVDELIYREQKSMQLYTELYKNWTDPYSNTTEFEILIQNIVPMITFPMIITDEHDEPYEPFEDFTLNINIDKKIPSEEQKIRLQRIIKDMSENYQPFIVKDGDIILAKFYYKHSPLIDSLKLFPLVEILVITVFIIIGYLAFSNIRKSEESKVWVGMAKEAAHQLGTPLSSMLAWIEIVKLNKNDPDAIIDTMTEMQNDIDRLNMIATRFSKIGSLPNLEEENLNEQINRVVRYFEKRLPHLGKKVQILHQFDDTYKAHINAELFDWVIENLLKNAAEAINCPDGRITISMSRNTKNKILISVTDNGKGMTSSERRQVFQPGYTTKKRGWGLGLNLSRRIVEDYHKGKIYIKDTAPGKGTTFNIEIPVKAT